MGLNIALQRARVHMSQRKKQGFTCCSARNLGSSVFIHGADGSCENVINRVAGSRGVVLSGSVHGLDSLGHLEQSVEQHEHGLFYNINIGGNKRPHICITFDRGMFRDYCA
ncbi:hypothetical protein DPMN_056474 [Dreissena polymorpha]|uniref:Uncharacterized protein n=1 Tax=Dreissena polymorpha TaxID=45954 RepID=A0A9D4CTH9_DREPO|nr:hypothetical protein DPMN_056474 [Dreissena polymorpha]